MFIYMHVCIAWPGELAICTWVLHGLVSSGWQGVVSQ
ncbi:Os02g0256500 [Oryza sativa Japonica Group]|uniref:Os02g0256500 protein n=1 Tax=Oryza sativa subsp. japonica TaxID=39947 RepID=A0A0P0VH62_ORYSJ|nr:hypothetical protein EE612_010185 [Oryza sativa]BAS77956.1 Os02g0256500 [Oryza sativa Japonica Group]